METYKLSVHQLYRLDQISQGQSKKAISTQKGEVDLGRLSTSRFSSLRFRRLKDRV